MLRSLFAHTSTTTPVENSRIISMPEFMRMCVDTIQADVELQKLIEEFVKKMDSAASSNGTKAIPIEQQFSGEFKVNNTSRLGLHKRKEKLADQTKQVPVNFFSGKNKQQIPTTIPQDPGFITQLAQTYLQVLLGPIGLTALGLGSLAVANAQDVVFNTGTPPGGTNLCSGLTWCIQGYLSNATSSEVLSQYMRDIGLTSSKGSYSTELALSKCFDQKKLASMMRKVIDNVSQWSGTASCSPPPSSIWQYTQFTAEATKLSSDACQEMQSAFHSAVTSCQTAKTGLADWGIALAVTLPLLCVFGSVAYCWFHKDSMDCSPRSLPCC